MTCVPQSQMIAVGSLLARSLAHATHWLAPGFLRPQRVHSLLDLGFVAAVYRQIIAAILRQVRLVHPAAFVVVAVLIALAVAELLRALVMRVAQMLRHRQRPAVLDVVARLADRHRGGV